MLLMKEATLADFGGSITKNSREQWSFSWTEKPPFLASTWSQHEIEICTVADGTVLNILDTHSPSGQLQATTNTPGGRTVSFHASSY